ncbi:hypothetical protein A4X09_0g4966, partial [Tilletia walkeri]
MPSTFTPKVLDQTPLPAAMVAKLSTLDVTVEDAIERTLKATSFEKGVLGATVREADLYWCYRKYEIPSLSLDSEGDEIDFKRLRSCWHALERVHEELRSGFILDGQTGDIVKVVWSSYIQVPEVAKARWNIRTAENGENSDGAASPPFDNVLSGDVLIAFTVGDAQGPIPVGGHTSKGSILEFIVHHALLDGTTMNLVFARFQALYASDANIPITIPVASDTTLAMPMKSFTPPKVDDAIARAYLDGFYGFDWVKDPDASAFTRSFFALPCDVLQNHPMAYPNRPPVHANLIRLALAVTIGMHANARDVVFSEVVSLRENVAFTAKDSSSFGRTASVESGLLTARVAADYTLAPSVMQRLIRVEIDESADLQAQADSLRLRGTETGAADKVSDDQVTTGPESSVPFVSVRQGKRVNSAVHAASSISLVVHTPNTYPGRIGEDIQSTSASISRFGVRKEHDDDASFIALHRSQPWVLLKRQTPTQATLSVEILPSTTGSHGFSVLFGYDDRLMRSKVVRTFAGHLIAIIESLVKSGLKGRTVENLIAELAFGDRPLALGLSRNRIQDQASLRIPPVQTLHELFEAQARRTPNKIALQYEDQDFFTYGQLDRRANAVAAGLHALNVGIGPGSIIPVCFDRSIDLVVALLAVLKAGAAYTPIDPAHPTERKATIIAATGATVVLVGNDVAGESELWTNAPGAPKLLTIDAAMQLARSSVSEESPSHSAPTEVDLAYIIFTSGTTGAPKGCMIEHRNVLSFLKARRSWVEGTTSARCLSVSAIAFDASITELWGSITSGAVYVLVPTTRTVETLPVVVEERLITVAEMTPTVLGSRAGFPSPWLQTQMVSGEPISPDMAVSLAHAGYETINAYGPTEATVEIAVQVLSKGLAKGFKSVPIGKPVGANAMYILAPGTTDTVPIGTAGELCVGGAQVGRGYLNDEEKTKA